MSKSCDLLLDNKYNIHLSIVPKLGLLIVNELEDFGETWLEVKVIENSKYKLQHDVTTISGIQTDGAIQAASRYFVDTIHNNLHKKAGPTLEQVGSLLKFMINVNLRPEILDNRNYITSLGNALGQLVSSCQSEMVTENSF